MATLTLQSPSSSGAVFAPVAAAANGDQFENTGAEFFYVKNASGNAITVTFDSPNTCSFGISANSAHDLAVAVNNGVEKLIGPFDTGRFNDGSNMVQVTYSAAASVTVAVSR